MWSDSLASFICVQYLLPVFYHYFTRIYFFSLPIFLPGEHNIFFYHFTLHPAEHFPWISLLIKDKYNCSFSRAEFQCQTDKKASLSVSLSTNMFCIPDLDQMYAIWNQGFTVQTVAPNSVQEVHRFIASYTKHDVSLGNHLSLFVFRPQSCKIRICRSLKPPSFSSRPADLKIKCKIKTSTPKSAFLDTALYHIFIFTYKGLYRTHHDLRALSCHLVACKRV